MTSLSGDYTDVYKFYKNENGDICFRNIDGSYLSVAKSMPFDKLLELENRVSPKVDCIIETKYTENKPNQIKFIYNKIRSEKRSTIIKPYFKKVKRIRGKSQILDFYVCTFCGTHHTDDTDECADCISNYERDMKYTNNRILEISNDHTLNDGAYYDFMNTMKEYLDSEHFRGFRRIDIFNFNSYSDIIMYFIDNNNKMVSKTVWTTTYYDDECYRDKYEYDYEIDDYIAEYEYEDPVDPHEINVDIENIQENTV